MLRILFCFTLFSSALLAQSDVAVENDAQKQSGSVEAGLERRVEVTPDLLEFVVDTDQNVQGTKARRHVFRMQLDADPLVNGRLSLGFQFRLNRFLTLDVPVSFDHPAFGQWLGTRAGIYHENIVNHWALLGGVGLKIRLSEWIVKSSFYLEPVLQAGYYHQTARTLNLVNAAGSIRIRPGLYFGFETIFDTGLTMDVKLGVEQPFDVQIEKNILSLAANLSAVSMFGLGYAW